MSEYKDCTFEGCMKPGRLGGYCDGHRMQERRGMELKPLRGYTTSTPIYCSFDGCNRGHHSYGYCQQHSYQRKKGQELRPIKQYRERKKKEEEEQG